MKVIGYLLAAALGALGVVFVAGNQGLTNRIIVGVILLASAIALVVAVRLRPRVETRSVVQKIDLPGKVSLQDLTCKNCAAHLATDAISVRAGTAFVECRYCGSAYQLEEAPKW